MADNFDNFELELAKFAESSAMLNQRKTSANDNPNKKYNPYVDEVSKVSTAASTNFIAGSVNANLVASTELNISDINVSAQVRKEFVVDEIDELADSISEHGLLTPITVIKDVGGKYKLICGEKRLRACKQLGLAKIKANIFELKQTDIGRDAQIVVLQIVENMQRSNPSLTDLINAIKNLRNINPSLDVNALSKLLSRDPSYIRTLVACTEFDKNEEIVLLPLGIAAIKRYYNPVKEWQSEEAAKFIAKALEIIDKNEDGYSQKLVATFKEALIRLYGNCKKIKEKEEKGLSSGPKTEKKTTVHSISLAKLNKIQEGTGDRLKAYMEQTEQDFEEAIVVAVDYFLDHLS